MKTDGHILVAWHPPFGSLKLQFRRLVIGSGHGNKSEFRRLPWDMPENPNPFADFDLERAIALRWTLRDIKAKRLKLSPVSNVDLRALIDLGLVEARDDAPVLTNAGHTELD